MDSKIVFDVTRESFDLSIIPFGDMIISLLGLSFLLYFTFRKREIRFSVLLIFLYFVWIGGSLITPFVSYINFIDVKNEVLKKKYNVIVGTVKNKKLQSGRTNLQYFYVKDIYFKICDGSYNGGYHKTVFEGGALQDGVSVRIFYVTILDENIIARLEILKN